MLAQTFRPDHMANPPSPALPVAPWSEEERFESRDAPNLSLPRRLQAPFFSVSTGGMRRDGRPRRMEWFLFLARTTCPLARCWHTLEHTHGSRERSVSYATTDAVARNLDLG